MTAAWQDRLDAARTDLAEVEQQLTYGELDMETARHLSAQYRREIASLEAAAPEPRAATMSPRRALLGTAVFLAAAAAVLVAVVVAIEPDDPGTPAVTDAVTTAQLEEILADDPGLLPMRLELARRYLDAGDFTSALDHYMVVLDDGPNAEALGYIGWMAYVSGDAATGAAYLERSIGTDPTFGPALWFLAQLRWQEERDAATAAELLTRLLSGEIPQSVRAEAEALLAEVEAAG